MAAIAARGLSSLLTTSHSVSSRVQSISHLPLFRPTDATVRNFSHSHRLLQSDEFSADIPEGSTNIPLPTQKGGTSPAVGATTDISNLTRLEKSLNRVQLLGRLGSDPQLRGSERHPVLLFSLATHENFRDEGGNLKQKTMWHRIAVFKQGLRETSYKYLKKGQRVYVAGQISYGQVKDPTTNVIRTTTSIIGDDVIVMSGPQGQNIPM